jgi:hypothetical protein
VSSLYKGKAVSALVFAKEALDEAVLKMIIEGVEASAGPMKPAIAVFNATVSIMKTFGNYTEIEDGALTNKANRICQLAYTCYDEAFQQNAMSKGDFNERRLLALMTLVSSKHAYETYAPWRTEQIELIQEMLVDFYRAAESFDIYDSKYIENTQARLQKKIATLDIYCDADFDTAIQDGDIFVFLVNYLVEQYMMGDGTGTVTEFDFCGESCNFGVLCGLKACNIVFITTSATIVANTTEKTAKTATKSFYTKRTDGKTKRCAAHAL